MTRLSPELGVYLALNVLILGGAALAAETVGVPVSWAIVIGYALSIPLDKIGAYCKDVEAGIAGGPL